MLTIKMALESQAETYESMARSLASHPELEAFWLNNANQSKALAEYFQEQADRLLNSENYGIRLSAKL